MKIPISLSLLIPSILVSVSVALCPATTFAQSLPASVTENQALAQIKIHIEQERGETALRLIEPFLDRIPPPDLIDHFTFWYAMALHRHGDDDQAIVVLEQFMEDYPASPLIHEASLRLSTLYIQTHQSNRAIAMLSRMLNLTSDNTTRREIQHQLRRAYEQQGHYHLAIQTAMTHMTHSEEAERRDLQDAINSLILQKMDERSLARVLETFPATYPGDLALIRRIELHMAQGDDVLAARDIRAFLHQFPEHLYARTASALLRSFVARIKAHRQVIAAVLPFSGTMKPFGTDAFNGLRLALEQEVFLGSNAIGLVVTDSAHPSTRIRSEVLYLLDEFKPIAMIGPLLADEVHRLADIPDRAAVPFMTPTANLTNVKYLGRYWFSTAMTTPFLVNHLVEYAMRTFGYTRFGTLTPRTTHGKHLNHIFQQTVIENGGAITSTASYQPGTTDASVQIAHIQAQAMRFQKAMAPPLTDESADPAPQPVREDEPLSSVPGLDALFLPGRPSDVAFLSAQLAFFDITVPLLGTNGWNHPTLLTWGRRTLEGGLFGDALFLQSPDPTVQHFVARYRERFQTDPSIFAAQAYDAMSTILATVRRGATTGAEVREQLSHRHDLPTLHGVSGFDEGSILNRKVYMMEIRDGHMIQLN